MAKPSMDSGCAAAWRAVPLLLALNSAFAQDSDSVPIVRDLKKLSLEELMDIEVTLVSKQPELLNRAPSAVQVITGGDIRRSGAATLPEALRLAPNLQVAQVDARQWAISARGFNNTLSNKLLVMIDGRTVYTPLFAGVFWDVQHVLLEDVERIEVISGPGGNLWGPNAVNGVINIVTLKAEETQGAYVSGAGGTFLRDFAAARFGGKAGPDVAYRVYGQRFDHHSADSANGRAGQNAWGLTQGGFRMDWTPGGDAFSVQGDAYLGAIEQEAPGEITVDGQNLLAHWTRSFGNRSEVRAQAYLDRTSSDIPGVFGEELWTYDLEFQHGFPMGSRQRALWGLLYRFKQDEVRNSPGLAFLPPRKNMYRVSAFVQDQIEILPERLQLTLGSRAGYNNFSELMFHPSGRLAWMPDSRHTLWTALSRAERAPSRIDVEFFLPVFPAPPSRLEGGPDFTSEKVLAYELGYRTQPRDWLSLSLAAFYNRYDDIRSVEQVDATTYVITNGLEGDARGLEFSGMLQAHRRWRLRGGYTYLEKDIWAKPGRSDYNQGRGEGNDPSHQLSGQSRMDLPAGFQLNGTGRWVGALPSPAVPGYFTYDAGLVWQFRGFEFALLGRNLAVTRHPEFGAEPSRHEIPRSVIAKVTWRQ